MEVRHQRARQKIVVPMTPMIDVVFQLLTFFIMTFQIVQMEGDFNIKMPLSAPRPGDNESPDLPPLRLRMHANAAGDLVGMSLADEPFGTSFSNDEERQDAFNRLRASVVRITGNEEGPAEIRSNDEIEIDADFNLKYRYTISAITAVSGRLSEEGKILALVEKIKFSPLHPTRPRMSPFSKENG